jgi:hypothetical protein
MCHGTSELWKSPSNRNHPTAQLKPVKEWAETCGACHDSSAAQAHISVQTSMGGAESCGVCHDADSEWSVEKMHKAY